jgi:hypothetical protein
MVLAIGIVDLIWSRQAGLTFAAGHSPLLPQPRAPHRGRLRTEAARRNCGRKDELLTNAMLALMMLVSIPTEGGHYLVDMVAGTGVAVAAIATSHTLRPSVAPSTVPSPRSRRIDKHPH